MIRKHTTIWGSPWQRGKEWTKRSGSTAKPFRWLLTIHGPTIIWRRSWRFEGSSNWRRRTFAT